MSRPKKLTPRERALIRQAITKYERETLIELLVQPCEHGSFIPFVLVSLADLKQLNFLQQRPPKLAFYFTAGSRFRMLPDPMFAQDETSPAASPVPGSH
jgi:hypothetical protein